MTVSACLLGPEGLRPCESGRLPFKQRPRSTHAAQEGDVARHAVRGQVLRRANRRAEQVQHPCRGGDELAGIDVQPLQDLRRLAGDADLLSRAWFDFAAYAGGRLDLREAKFVIRLQV